MLPFSILLIFLFQGYNNKVLEELDMGTPQDAYLLGGLQSSTIQGDSQNFKFLEQTCKATCIFCFRDSELRTSLAGTP